MQSSRTGDCNWGQRLSVQYTLHTCSNIYKGQAGNDANVGLMERCKNWNPNWKNAWKNYPQKIPTKIFANVGSANRKRVNASFSETSCLATNTPRGKNRTTSDQQKKRTNLEIIFSVTVILVAYATIILLRTTKRRRRKSERCKVLKRRCKKSVSIQPRMSPDTFAV